MRHGSVAGVLVLALSAGCASLETVRNAPETKGSERVYDASYERMVELLEVTLPELGLENIEKQPQPSGGPGKTVFLGSAGMDLWSWGEVVRVIAAEVAPSKTSVRIYWRHKFRDGLISFAPNWTVEVFEGIEERLP